jgi:hypothetical protein
MDETLASDELTLCAEEAGSSSITFRLMGFLPFKTIAVNVEEEKILIPE